MRLASMKTLLTKARLLIITYLLVLSSSVTAQVIDPALRDIQKIEVTEKQLLEAVASRTLTWLTGSSTNNDHISVGRLSNYFGFVGLRVGSGHSLTRSDVANDTLAVLNEDQRNALITLLDIQKVSYEEVKTARLQMNRALEGLLVGENISENDFIELGRNYGRYEAKLGSVIAQRLGDIAQTLTPKQRATLTHLRTMHISGKGHEIKRQKLKLKLSREDKQELVNLSARFLSWLTGSQMYNDFEVVGKPSQHFGFVSLRKEANHGVKRGDVAKEVIEMLTPSQLKMLTTSAAHNNKEFEKFLTTRSKLMRTLEASLSGESINPKQVRQFGEWVGEIEANMTWAQATAMLQVRNSMSNTQTLSLLALRDKYVAVEDISLELDPVERGRQLFAQCVLCHNSTATKVIGPDLAGIIGRTVASQASYDGYSTALQTYAQSEKTWTENRLDTFLREPKVAVPGTYMGFDGLELAKDRAAVIAYLKTM